MGESQAGAANTAFNINQRLERQMYGLSSEAMKGGMGYLTGAYGKGGYDQSAKYSAQMGSAMDAMAGRSGSFLDPRSFGNAAAGRAEAMSSVGAGQILSGMDEMNKLRSQLAGQGLQTTNFAQAAGDLSTRAIEFMPQNQTMSAINAGMGLASSIYGGGKEAGWWGKGSVPGSGTAGFSMNLQPTNPGAYGAGNPMTSFYSPSGSMVGGPTSFGFTGR